MGINQIGYDVGNIGDGSITDGRRTPWLQDIDDPSVWASWSINYRDVLVVDGDRRAVHVVNLSNEGLQFDDNYCNLASVMAAVQEGAGAEEIELLPQDGACPPGVVPPSEDTED